MNLCFFGTTEHPAPEGSAVCKAHLEALAGSEKAMKLLEQAERIMGEPIDPRKRHPSRYDNCKCGAIKWKHAIRCRKCSEEIEYKPCSALLRDGSKCEFRARGGGHCTRCSKSLLDSGKPRIPTGSYKKGSTGRASAAKALLAELRSKLKPRIKLEDDE